MKLKLILLLAIISPIVFSFFYDISASENASVTQPATQIKWHMLIIELFGGMSLFLYGMDKMGRGMKNIAGNKMRSFLSALTSGRILGLFVGIIFTIMVQSSTATTVMLVSFVEAGFLTFGRCLSVILGADIGTTVTTQLIAFKITQYALFAVTIGFCLQLLSSKDFHKQIGLAILGFGLLFFGMEIMSNAMIPLRNHPGFLNILGHLENPLLAVCVGCLCTILIHSSGAFIGIIIVFAQQHLISLEAGIPLLLGSNIGTCFTTILASIGTSRDAKRVAIAHVAFKVLGVLLFIWWIPSFAQLIQW